MSQEAEIMFEMERRRREQLFLARVSNKTQEFYQRYRKQYDDMIARGYAECISDEMRRFKQDLDTISSLLQSDPVSARVVSQEVGSYIHTLWGLGAEAQKIFQEKARLERERLKQEQAQRQSETLSHYYDVISNLDSITASFAANELATIKQRISNNGISSIQELTARLQPIISNASIQASDWKEKSNGNKVSKPPLRRLRNRKRFFALRNLRINLKQR